jgi:biopolymer transport protein ExbD
MRRGFQTGLKIISGRPDITPMIDVVFLLLIFFMLSSSFVQISGIPVALPSVPKPSAMSVDKLVVTIDQKGVFYFNDLVMDDWDSLAQQLQKCKADWNANTVIIRADEKTDYGVVARLMGLARSLDLNVYVATLAKRKTNETVFEDDAK